jgi:hypothetical protein
MEVSDVVRLPYYVEQVGAGGILEDTFVPYQPCGGSPLSRKHFL